MYYTVQYLPSRQLVLGMHALNYLLYMYVYTPYPLTV